MVSFELWQDGKLVAGEFGSMTGCSYTSFSGFHRVDSAGSVQMAMTARLLQRAGFDFWDMGQEHAYKLRVGAAMEPRDAFLRRFRDARARPSRLAALAARGGGRSASCSAATPDAGSPVDSVHVCDDAVLHHHFETRSYTRQARYSRQPARWQPIVGIISSSCSGRQTSSSSPPRER